MRRVPSYNTVTESEGRGITSETPIDITTPETNLKRPMGMNAVRIPRGVRAKVFRNLSPAKRM